MNALKRLLTILHDVFEQLPCRQAYCMFKARRREARDAAVMPAPRVERPAVEDPAADSPDGFCKKDWRRM